MREEEILEMLDIHSLCTAGVYPLPSKHGHVDGGQGYSWERERYFTLSPLGVQLITCFRHRGDNAGDFEVVEWSVDYPHDKLY